MTVLTAVVVLAAAPVILASLYLLALTMCWRRPQPHADAAPLRVCLLVPAHNEARGIGRTVRSLQALRYPHDHVRIVVMADNCSDYTAAIARAHGAEVLERCDADRRGKGWALRVAIDTLLVEATAPADAWDVLVVVDADTLVEVNLLEVITRHVRAGHAAVQVAYRPHADAASPTAVITDVAFSAFHLVRSGARERMGLSCGLRGNGMALTRQVLREVPHTAYTRTEDLEFGILLGLHGIRVAFAGDTTVYGDMPEAASVVTQQRERWIGGRLALARRFVPRLLGRAICDRRWMLADLAIDLMIPPVSALVVCVAAGLVVTGAGWALHMIPGSVIAIWAVATVALAGHVWHAAWVIGRTRALIGACVSVPAYAFGKARIAARGLRSTADVWIRTTREGEGA